MEKKEDRRVRVTKRMLKDALIELLKTKDIYHISIRELCETADVNRTTFYKYYGNQFDLLADMEDAGVGPSASGWQASARIPPISRKLPMPETAQVVAPRKYSVRFFHQIAAFTTITSTRNGRPALLLRDCSIRLMTSAHTAGFHRLPRIRSFSVHSRYRQNAV